MATGLRPDETGAWARTVNESLLKMQRVNSEGFQEGGRLLLANRRSPRRAKRANHIHRREVAIGRRSRKRPTRGHLGHAIFRPFAGLPAKLFSRLSSLRP